MRVRKIELTHFMPYAEATIELPATGIVVVTGPNGEGKSTLLEAVAVALGGKTLRSTPWWAPESKGAQVRLTSDTGTIERTKKANTSKLLIDGEGADTLTKTQALLEAKFGTLDVWRRTSVFSSAAVEGRNLSGATDADRKRLLEAVLGLSAFDAAYANARADRKKAEREVERAEHAVDLAENKVVAAGRRIKDAEGQLAAMPDAAAAQAASEEAETKIKQLDGEVGLLDTDINAIIAEVNGERAEIEELKKDAVRLREKVCHNCGQEISDQLRDQASAELKRAKKAITPVIKDLEERQAKLQAARKEAADELREWKRKADDARAEMRSARKLAEARSRAEQVIAEAKTERADAEDDLDVAEDDLLLAGRELDTLAAVVKVLGMKGVRATVLGQTLDTLSRLTNRWLLKMDPDMQVELRGTKATKSGHTDAISIEIKGAGGGHGYKACSAGQRRRIDVALLLALASMASAAAGRAPGTLFFDEVFDVLDTDGLAGVGEALAELSKDRCIVVVSHSPDVVAALPAARHLRCYGGQVEAV